MSSLRSILILRADELRHRALAAQLQLDGFNVSELIVRRNSFSSAALTPFERQHFEARYQFESDYFGALTKGGSEVKSQVFSDVNSAKAVRAAQELDPDLIVVFGAPILDAAWIQAFPRSLLGIHLGLSPYFRGSGTNIWPLSQGLPEAIGFTLMQLDTGIDTGQIVHQRRAQFVIGDSVHSVNCRLLQLMFNDIVHLAFDPTKLSRSEPQSRNLGSLIRRADMTEEALHRVYRNFNAGMVESYLGDKINRDAKFPLILEQALGD